MKGVTACARPSVTTKTTASTVGTRYRRRGGAGSRRVRLADGTAVRVGVVMVARSRRSGIGQGGDTRLTLRAHPPRARIDRWEGAQSVLALDDEVGAADRAGELRLLPRELEAGQLVRDVHAVRELEPDRALAAVGERPEDVDRQPGLVEDVGPAHAVDLELRRLERRRPDDDVALLLEDAGDVVDDVVRLVRRLGGEGVVVLVLEVAGLVGAQPRQRLRDGRGLQTDRRDLREVDFVCHVRPSAPKADLRWPSALRLVAGGRPR